MYIPWKVLYLRYFVFTFINYEVGDFYNSVDCEYSCSCSLPSTLICTTKGCDDYQECLQKDGVYDCYCQEGFTYDGKQCVRGK